MECSIQRNEADSQLMEQSIFQRMITFSPLQASKSIFVIWLVDKTVRINITRVGFEPTNFVILDQMSYQLDRPQRLPGS